MLKTRLIDGRQNGRRCSIREVPIRTCNTLTQAWRVVTCSQKRFIVIGFEKQGIDTTQHLFDMHG